MTIAFLNPPWFAHEPTGKPNEVRLRRGIRAGSRWPFSVMATHAPGTANLQHVLGQYVPAPIFLQSAAAWVQRAIPAANVILRDSIARYESYDEFDAWWQKTAPDAVIIETGSAALEHDLRYVKAMKASNAKVRIAVAGPPARELSHRKEWVDAVDAFLLGEYEKPATRFANGERGVLDFDFVSKAELATAPLMMMDEDAWFVYADANPKGASWPELQMWASRGCNYRCSFCSFPATMTNDDPYGENPRKIRFISPEWVEKFILHRMALAVKAGVPLKSIRFDDDTANSWDKHTLAICAVMRKIGLPWSMMCRADTSSRAVWQEMKDSGCFGVKIGFESGSDRIVNQVVGKNLDLKEAEETCRFLRRIGMEVHTTWQINAPTETPEERQSTMDIIQRFYDQDIHSSHQLSGMATLDGTPLANAHPENTDPNFRVDPDGAHKVEGMLKA